MKKKKGILLMGITLVLCVLLFLERLTGPVCHAVLGLALTVIFIVHVCRQNRKRKYRRKSVQFVDWALAALLVVLVLTGILLHPMQGVPALKIIHKLAAVLLVLGIIVHGVQHKKQIGPYE